MLFLLRSSNENLLIENLAHIKTGSHLILPRIRVTEIEKLLTELELAHLKSGK